MNKKGKLNDDGYAAIRAAYTQLPDELPDSVAALAKEITSGSTNDAQAVLKLAQYLARNTTYSLNPAIPPADQDFVAHFLETKTGYCTYYASAMTVLSRTLGIPARYAEGYRLPDTAKAGEEITLTQQQAHAWCEVYLKGIGWIPVDVSAGDEASLSSTTKPQPETHAHAKAPTHLSAGTAGSYAPATKQYYKVFLPLEGAVDCAHHPSNLHSPASRPCMVSPPTGSAPKRYFGRRVGCSL